MDPLACWRRLVDALKAGDLAEVLAAADDLNAWRLRGGFKPDPVPGILWEPFVLAHFARVCSVVLGSA
jgi:hypothetical protein